SRGWDRSKPSSIEWPPRSSRERTCVVPAESRARIAAEQEALLAALLDAGPIPAHFDPTGLSAATRALEAKRRRADRHRPPSRPARASWWQALRRWLAKSRGGEAPKSSQRRADTAFAKESCSD